MLSALLLSFGDSGLAVALRQSAIAYPLVSATHIIGIGLLFVSMVLLDLRLLGLLKQRAVTELFRLLRRLAAVGLLLAMLTGTLLFSVQPAHYLANDAFILKMLLLGLALLNILLVHRLPAWQAAQAGQPVALALKICALISLLLWLAVLLAGRWIAFI